MKQNTTTADNTADNRNGQRVRIPRFHYRDVNADAAAILETARAAGSVRSAMVDYLLKRKDKLPEGLSAEAAADSILKTVDGFAVAHADGKTPADIAEALRQAVADMEESQALVYLAVLEETFRVCDARAAIGAPMDPESFREHFREILEAAKDVDLQSRIDSLAEAIQGNSGLAFVYAAGNDDLLKAARATSGEGDAREPDASAIQAAIEDKAAMAERYAATACACYGALLDGKVEGVDGRNVNPEVMTALVVAGLEKASILRRLLRGEIDSELARNLLDALGKTLKWMLAWAIRAVLMVGVALGVVFLMSITEWMFASAPVLLAIGLLVGFWAVRGADEDINDLVEFVAHLTELAVVAIVEGVKWVGGLARKAGAKIRDVFNEEEETETTAVPQENLA